MPSGRKNDLNLLRRIQEVQEKSASNSIVLSDFLNLPGIDSVVLSRFLNKEWIVRDSNNLQLTDVGKHFINDNIKLLDGNTSWLTPVFIALLAGVVVAMVLAVLFKEYGAQVIFDFIKSLF